MNQYSNFSDYLQGAQQRLNKLVAEQKAGRPLPERGVIIGLYMSCPEPESKKETPQYVISDAVDSLHISGSGIVGSRHERDWSPAGGRNKELYNKKTMIKYLRHTLITSPYDIKQYTKFMQQIDKNINITPEQLGANMIIKADHPYSASLLPPGTRVMIDEVASLAVYTQQFPCGVQGRGLESFYNINGIKDVFKGKQKEFEKARDHRGVLAFVMHPQEQAEINLGMEVRFVYTTGQED